MTKLGLIGSIAKGIGLRALLWAVTITFAISQPAISQVVASVDDPAGTIRKFKTSVDENDLSSMCSLMAESDSSGPLTPLHFEKMQSSMSELVKLWQYTSFSFNGTTIDENEMPPRATVKVTASQIKQQVRFALLKFKTGWYICDIEIYFK